MQHFVNIVDTSRTFQPIYACKPFSVPDESGQGHFSCARIPGSLLQFSFLREGLDDLACLLACFDTAENEPCKVCPLSAYRSPRLYVKVASLGRS